MLRLAGHGPVLVHFFDFAQLNSVRALPYVREWHRRYANEGLSVVGVQAPRFAFGSDPAAVRRGLERLAVEHPVAIDAEREMWLDYGCEGWPSLFLWGRGGVLRWYQFGEGEYAATEEAIQQELRESDALRTLPAPMQPLRPTDEPGAAVIAPTPEFFPAGEGNSLPAHKGGGIELGYEGGGAYVTAEGAGTLIAVVGDRPESQIEVDGAALYELATHPRHEAHRLRLELAEGEAWIWSISFAPGVP
jgi:hypothetical protein